MFQSGITYSIYLLLNLIISSSDQKDCKLHTNAKGIYGMDKFVGIHLLLTASQFVTKGRYHAGLPDLCCG